MNAYQELRAKVLKSLEAFQQHYEREEAALPVARKKNIQDIMNMIDEHDQQCLAYEFRKDLKQYVEALTLPIFRCWVPGFSVTHLQRELLKLLDKPKYKSKRLGLRERNECLQKLKERKVWVAGTVEFTCQRLQSQLDQAKSENRLLNDEVKRLRVEASFLTQQLSGGTSLKAPRLRVKKFPKAKVKLTSLTSVRPPMLWTDAKNKPRQVDKVEPAQEGCVIF